MDRHEEGSKKTIGELLVEAEYVTPENLEQARKIRKRSGERIYSILIDLGHLTEESFLEFLSQMPGTASIDLTSIKIEGEIIELAPEELARRLELVPIGKLGNTVTVAMVCPLDKEGLQELEDTVGMKVRPVLCARSAILGALDSHYKKESTEPVIEGEATEAVSVAEAPEEPAAKELQAPEEQEETAAEALPALEGPMKLARVAQLVNEIEDLPTLPAILNRVSEVVNDPESSAADLAKVVSSDGSLSAKLLRLANSPAYGFSRKISDIQHAIALLGFAETQALAISASVFDQLSNKADFDYKGHWHHSLAAATLARMISFHLKVGGMETAFTAGLLHDVGKLLLAIKMGGKQERVESIFSSEVGASKLEVEQNVLGITHAEVGYLLGEHWLLPSIVTGAIRYHHTPELDSETKIITNIVYLGNLYCEASQFAESIVFDESVLQSLAILEISQDAFRETLKSYSEIVAELPPVA